MNEYLTSNEHIAYPFRDDAIGLARPGTDPSYSEPLLPTDFLIDAVTLYYGGEQLYLTGIVKDGSSYELQIGTMAEVIITGTVTPSAFGTVIAFQNLADGISFKGVVGSGFSDYLSGMIDSVSFGTSLPFVERAMDSKPYKLLSLGTLLDAYDGEVSLYEGYNVVLELDEDTGEITLSVQPGGGIGLYNPCEDDVVEPIDYIASLSGKRAAAADPMGRFLLEPGDEGCFRIVPGEHELQIMNDCRPCCECDDYVNVAKLFQNLLDDLSLTHNSINATANVYNQDVEDFEALVPDLCGVKIYGGGIKGIETDFVALSITIHNFCTGKAVTCTFVAPDGYELHQGTYTLGTTTVPTTMGGVTLFMNANECAVFYFLLKPFEVEEGVEAPPLGTSAGAIATWTNEEGEPETLEQSFIWQ